jgi:hypothetical protein
MRALPGEDSYPPDHSTSSACTGRSNIFSLNKFSDLAGSSNPKLWDQVREVIGRDFLATRLVRAKFKRSVFCIDMDDLALADLAFKNVETERIENLFLNRAL